MYVLTSGGVDKRVRIDKCLVCMYVRTYACIYSNIYVSLIKQQVDKRRLGGVTGRHRTCSEALTSGDKRRLGGVTGDCIRSFDIYVYI